MNMGAAQCMNGYIIGAMQSRGNLSVDIWTSMAVFDGTNNTSRLGVVKRPFGD